MTGIPQHRTTSVVTVSSPDAGRLIALLTGPAVAITSRTRDRFDVVGVPAMTIGTLAALHGLVLQELHTVHATLAQAGCSATDPAVPSTRLSRSFS